MRRVIRQQGHWPTAARLDREHCHGGIDGPSLPKFVRVRISRIHHRQIRGRTGERRIRRNGCAWSHEPAPAMDVIRQVAPGPSDAHPPAKIADSLNDALSNPWNDIRHVLWIGVIAMTTVRSRGGVRMSRT